MPTKKNRFLVTIGEEQHRALKALAGMRGVSVSRLVNEMLKPAVEPILDLVRASQNPVGQADLEDFLGRTEAKLSSDLAEVREGAAKRAGRHSKGAGRPAAEETPARASSPRSARAGGSGASSGVTPLTNRGVTSGQRPKTRVKAPGSDGGGQ